MSTVRMPYSVTLSATDVETLLWLSARGYDGAFYDSATEREALTDDDDSPVVFRFTEADAWAVNEAVEADPDAFLACNGSETLSKALYGFLGSIV